MLEGQALQFLNQTTKLFFLLCDTSRQCRGGNSLPGLEGKGSDQERTALVANSLRRLHSRYRNQSELGNQTSLKQDPAQQPNRRKSTVVDNRKCC
jgi:hypothetical protein